MNIQTIPLNKLSRSDLNVRKTEPDADIESLADDIAARGLKQNLVVIPKDSSARTFEVVAGGRRLQALQLLVKRKALKATTPIPVIIEAREEGTETSLSENLHRVAMNPADEFEAFRTIIEAAEGGEDERIAYCAKRFGVTETHVRGRLRLAALAPVVLDALRANTIGIGSAMAYAAVTDQELQAKVFAEQSKSFWRPHEASQVRDALRQKTYGEQDRKVRYLGVDAYEAAGGRFDTDLFTQDAERRLVDTQLVDKLAKEKAEAELPALIKKHKLTDAVVQFGHSTPKAPKGWQSRWDYSQEKLKERQKSKAKTIGIFMLTAEGEGWELKKSEFFIPEDEVEKREVYNGMTDEEREAERREHMIERFQARLALPNFAGTPLEGRVFLPRPGAWHGIDEDGKGNVYLEVKIRLTTEEVDAQREAAEKAYDDYLVEEAEAKARAERESLEREAARARQFEEWGKNPPAVVQWEDGTVLYRWQDGAYADLPEGDDEEEGVALYFETLADLLNEVEVAVRSWATLEAFEAEQAADATPETEDATA